MDSGRTDKALHPTVKAVDQELYSDCISDRLAHIWLMTGNNSFNPNYHYKVSKYGMNEKEQIGEGEQGH
jgi:hypothetical protein